MKSTQHSLPRPVSRALVAAAIACCLIAFDRGTVAQGVRRSGERWVGSWVAGMYAAPPPRPTSRGAGREALLSTFNNQTLRQIVHTSIGGERVRVVLSNVFGAAPLAIGAASIALREKNATIIPNTSHPLTFNGSRSTRVAPGSIVISDPTDLTVTALSDLAIDIYLPGELATATSPFTIHDVALQTNYLSPSGNYTETTEMPVTATTGAWYFLARVEVDAPERAGAVVTVGDSITNGTVSTPDTNNRWPDELARRLVAADVRLGVLNAAIDGNRLLSDGNNGSASVLARFDRDVLAQTGVTHVIVLVGVNDLRNEPSTTAADLIGGHRRLVERARARGLRIFGGTLTPAEGSSWTADQEAKRRAFNEWLRTSRWYDGVIDFDAAVRDPSHPTRILLPYDSGGGLHPNDTGYRAMGAAIDLALLNLRAGSR
jgi:lysophospholipase L1-like esterase